MYLSAEKAGAVRCAEKSLLYLPVCSVHLSFLSTTLSAFLSKHSHHYCYCAFPFCPVGDSWPHFLTVCLSSLDLSLFAVSLSSSSSLLFFFCSLAFHFSKQSFEKRFFLQAGYTLMKWLRIIIGLFQDDCLYPTSSFTFPLSPLLFAVIHVSHCCCCCEHVWMC